MKNRDSFFSQIVVAAFSVLPLIDSLNGFMVSNEVSIIGMTYKLFIVLLLGLIVTVSKKINYYYLISMILVVLFLLISIWINSNINSSAVKFEYDFPLKMLFNLIILFLMINLISEKIVGPYTVNHIIDNNVKLIILVVLIPYVLGLGKTIYAGELGYKAFYYSQNELAASLIILFYYSLYKFTTTQKFSDLLKLFGLTLSIVLLNSKSSIATIAIGFIILGFVIMRQSSSSNKYIYFFIAFLGLITTKNFLLGQYENFLVRQSTLYSMYGGNIFNTLLSGRNYKLSNAWHLLMNGSGTSIKLLIGNGFFSNFSIEMDFFDTFFYLGLAGSMGLILFIVWIIKKSFYNSQNYYNWLRFVSFFIILGYSFLAGHVLYMGTSGCYFVLWCCFNMWPQEIYFEMGEKV